MSSRVSKKSLSPSKRAPNKRDSSYLDWHFKRPVEEELEDQYKCFTEEEWALHYQAAKEETALQSRKKNDPVFMNAEAKRLACDGCQVFHQLWARRKGFCNPIPGAVTPLDRMGIVEDG